MPSAGDLVDLRVRAVFDGQPIINTFSFSIIDPAADWATQANDVAAAFAATVHLTSPSGEWLAGRSVGYQMQALEVIDVAPGVSPLASFAYGANGPVEDEDALPPNDSLCVTLRTNFKGAAGRGRVYLCGYAEGSQSGGFWVPEIQDAASAIMIALNTDYGETGGGSMRWCVLHRVDHGTRVVPPEVKPIMSFTVHNEVRSIGRRAVGRRIHRTRHT